MQRFYPIYPTQPLPYLMTLKFKQQIFCMHAEKWQKPDVQLGGEHS